MERIDFARTSEPDNLLFQRGHIVPYARHIGLDTTCLAAIFHWLPPNCYEKSRAIAHFSWPLRGRTVLTHMFDRIHVYRWRFGRLALASITHQRYGGPVPV